jgi:tetratricopeptide (TPR) repeat protein
MNTTQFTIVAALALLPGSMGITPAAIPALDLREVAGLVARIQRADYEGDRATLKRLYDALTPVLTPAGGIGHNNADDRLASRVHYWRGFALWRRAINGFNDSVDPKDLEADLRHALGEFDEALSRDSKFADASVGSIGALQGLAFLYRNDPVAIQEFIPRLVQLLKDGVTTAPDNPRFLWVYGGSQGYSPPGLSPTQVDERRAKAIATYQRGLELSRKQKNGAGDPLEPAWGEPELLMSLAWANLNRPQPDPRAAEEYARQALALVPHWRYMRDILMPQIEKARVRP